MRLKGKLERKERRGLWKQIGRESETKGERREVHRVFEK